MIIIVDGLLIGLGIGLGLMGQKLFQFKRNPSSDDVEIIRDISHIICPKCKIIWNCERYITYCECMEYHEGHFHFKCYGGYGDRKGDDNFGCKYEWILKAH
jgi:hypothetical protein